ncbi:MAG TPA: RNA polymerase sigma-70 factor [Bacteroidales bacterium]
MNDKDFEKIFREHFGPLTNLAYTVVKDADVAKDVVQQVFLKFWQNRNDITIRSSMKSYLYRAVVNTGLNYISRDKRFTSLEIQPVESVQYEAESLVEADSSDVIANKVHEAIHELSPVCREVFQMSRFSDLTNKEIALELNISVKTVEKHITKAIKILREKLKPLMQVEVVVLFWLPMIGMLNLQVGFFYLLLS